jgi:MocE subfamily Rieske [2Fe-2S] domain protein
MSRTPYNRYNLIGDSAQEAVRKGLAEADWYASPIPKEKMRELLTRKNGPAIRDTIIWFSLLIVTGFLGYMWWGTWLAIIPFAIYGIVYASSSDSRWHEASHGTAFKSDWLNNALYEVACFMVVRESNPWRWSHTRHHSDTIIVGRDPEIAVPRPPDLLGICMGFFALGTTPKEWKKIILHCLGRMTAVEKTYVPESEFDKIFFKARIWVAIYLFVIGLALYWGSILPLMYVGLPSFYGSWLMPFYGLTQHAGLAENVLDHRLNCRTVKMNFIHRYLYWNMNYHVEHHMFPLVPYHALPRLHELMKDDTPEPYTSIYDAFKEIIPTLFKQVKDPTYHAVRVLPATAGKSTDRHGIESITPTGRKADDGWIELCRSDLLRKEDVVRYDHEGRSFAIYRTEDGSLYGTDGICTHGNAHLADGMVKGDLIECPKHNGRFDVRDGSIQRPPVCVGIKTYKVEDRGGNLFIDLETAGGAGVEDEAKAMHTFKVVSNDNVATFIKELNLVPVGETKGFHFKPGDYIQLNIPEYEMTYESIEVQEPYAPAWLEMNLFECRTHNETPVRRNYSLVTNPEKEDVLKFNVRIATPPAGKNVNGGVGSSYVFNLKPGDEVTAIGPFGDFHIREESDKEMIYVGGGAGMAPLRSHLSYLFESLNTQRKVSYWYGARSSREMFYQDYFEDLASRHENFDFNVAMSEPQSEDDWTGPRGFIHEVLDDDYLKAHPDPKSIEYYLCGPPMMIQATSAMLSGYGVGAENISYDEF